MVGEQTINETLEVLIDIAEGLYQEEGYVTKRLSETKYHSCSQYDQLILKDVAGKEFLVSFEENKVFNEDKSKWEDGNYMGEE